VWPFLQDLLYDFERILDQIRTKEPFEPKPWASLLDVVSLLALLYAGYAIGEGMYLSLSLVSYYLGFFYILISGLAFYAARQVDQASHGKGEG
jgi:hypothetical protein